MKRLSVLWSLPLILVMLCQMPARSQTRERADVPAKDTWNLQHVYPSEEAWDAARKKLADEFPKVSAFKGTLAKSPDRLLACLKLNTSIDKELTRLFCYVAMKSDEDTRNSKYQGMKQVLRKMATDYSSRASFIAPEVAAMDDATIAGFIRKEPGLKVYRMYLGDIQRTKAHLRSPAEEKILAEAGLLASAPGSIYSIFANAELPFPEITLSDGQKVRLNQAGYGRYRAVRNRADREAVFAAFFGSFDRFKQTIGTSLSSQVNKDLFYTRVRSYESSLHRALDADNIPVEVYHSLVANVNRNLGSFHRYLRLKQRMLGVKQLKYSDVYAPVVEKVDLKYSYEQAIELVLDAVKPMGPDYVAVVKKSFDERWIDVYPTPGKRSGAYCNGGCYDVHPYMLLNYNGQYDDVSTLAHEMGHAMHSYYSNKTQPYASADYATFVAEVASTLNEALLIDRTLSTIDDDDVKLSLLMNYLDGIKGTVFRQTQFAEFELAIHQKAQRGEPLTGDTFTEIYADILKRYYGHEQGVCLIDDRHCVEWAYIPHFYRNFYVYQYSTSFTASTALSQKILSGEEGAVGRTIEFLSAGGSDYPVAILKRAGVDMMTSDPFDRTMVVMNRVMDQIEEILDRRK
ncbi:MAG: oligoendopeptidase F [Candidatus Nealsonbacteria bacterium]|nr:oligoendopeptidase F [Candidatus Nealsonbacteria bacterium]